MKTLIVEDDFTCRLLLQTVLSRYGECHVAVNGNEAVAAFCLATGEGSPYDLICMDILMPELNGEDALRQIRAHEEARGIVSSKGAKIIMTTAMTGLQGVINSFRALCDAYLTKPVDIGKLRAHLNSFGLIE